MTANHYKIILYYKLEIYKCVMMRIFYTIRQPGQQPKKHPLRLKSALNNLVNAMGSTSEEGEKEAGSEASECCICLCTLSPYQALFLAPCSHCRNYFLSCIKLRNRFPLYMRNAYNPPRSYVSMSTMQTGS